MRSLDLDQLFEIMDPTQLPAGFNLPRKKWSQLNRIRTDHGRCGHLLYNIGDCFRPLIMIVVTTPKQSHT